MRVVAGFGVFFVLGGFAALAQTGPQSTGSGTLRPDAASWTCTFDENGGTGTVCKSAMVPACPLDMHVRQRAGGTLVSTDDRGRRVETFAARLKLELKDLRPDRPSQHMVTAKVTVRGWTPKERILPLDSGIDRNGNLVKTMTVPLTGGGLPDASADLWLPGFTAARMVRLESITLDDGAVWNFRSCEAAPDLYMPVDSSN
jgi:hypothetical protein